MMKRLASLRLLVVHHRNVVEDEGVEFVGDPEIVGRAERLLAQLLESEARDPHRRRAARAARGP